MKRTLFSVLAIAVVGGLVALYLSSRPTQTQQAAAVVAPERAATEVTTIRTEAQATNVAAAPTAAAPAQSEARIELAQADLDAVTTAGFVEGRHYRRLSPAQPTSSGPDQVEVNEFFMYSCIHCYNLEPYVHAWLEAKPATINFVPIPTTWDEARKLHAQGYYMAEALGKAEEMHMPFFQEMHVNGNYLETPAKMKQFFGRFNVSGSDFDGLFDSFAMRAKVSRADELGRRYRVDSTPTIIINGKYRTDVSMAGGSPEQLFQLIELLAAAELGQ